MNKLEFIEYTAKRYGFDESLAETLINMFVDTLQKIVSSGQEFNIDEIGVFRKLSLCPNCIKHKNNVSLKRTSVQNYVSFKASDAFNSSMINNGVYG